MIAMLDLVLAGIVVEAAVLLAVHRLTGRGLGRAALLPNLAAGGFLLLAARVGMGGAAWFWVSACLLAGLVAHVVDLRQRWR